MEYTVTNCKNCPLYIFRFKTGGINFFEFESYCGHPNSNKEHIRRVYDADEQLIVPAHPENCPLNNEELIIKK